MRVIGASSGGVGHEGNVDRVVEAIMTKSGHEAEIAFTCVLGHRYASLKMPCR